MHDPGPVGPYQSQTNTNTSTDWLNDMKPVEAKLDGMIDYAKAVMVISDNLFSHQMRLTQTMNTVAMDAFPGTQFPEIAYAGTVHGRNLGEFGAYLNQVYQGIQHIGNAAKAVADAYGGADGFSAIDLNAVQFAFGFPDATRPDGLPPGIGQTFSDAEMKAYLQALKDGKTPAHSDSAWEQAGVPTTVNGVTTIIFHDQYGGTRTVTVSTDAQGNKITKIVDPNGTRVDKESTFSYPYGTVTTTTTTVTDSKGNSTTHTNQTSTYSSGNQTTTTTSSDGTPKTETKTTYDAGGGRTDTTYSVGKGGSLTQTGQTAVGGGDNTVENGMPDSPAQESTADERAKVAAGQPHTQVVAPGKPGSHDSGSGTTTTA